jgi:translation initiation factor 1A
MPKKSGKNNPTPKIPRSLLEKDEDTEYALIGKALGGGKFSLQLNMSATEMIGRLCGKMKRGKNRENRVDPGSVVLVGIRDFQDNMVDILYVYNPQEVRQLQKNGSIIFDCAQGTAEDDGDDIVFDENFNFEDI